MIMLKPIGILVIALSAWAQAPEISAARIRAHDRFLASDLLEGRGVGASRAENTASSSSIATSQAAAAGAW